MIDHFQDAKDELLRKLADRRYSEEIKGVTVNGVLVRTDEVSQAKVAGALLHVGRNPNVRVDWKGATGWTRMTKAQIEAVADIVASHVQACYSAERAHAEAIENITDINAFRTYDFSVGWPS